MLATEPPMRPTDRCMVLKLQDQILVTERNWFLRNLLKTHNPGKYRVISYHLLGNVPLTGSQNVLSSFQAYLRSHGKMNFSKGIKNHESKKR